MSNSKLNAVQKDSRKNMLIDHEANGGEIFSFPQYFATVAIVPEFTGSNMSCMSVSVCSPDETKFRRKVGEFYALDKLFAGECVKMPTPVVAEYFASDFAAMLGQY